MTTSLGTDDATASARPVLTVDGLTITAGSLTLVDDVSFSIAPQQRVGLIGASGSGKTLTSMAVAGLLADELDATGSVRLDGFDTDLLQASERTLATMRGRLAGMIFQEPMTALNPTMRIDRQVAEVMRIHRQSMSREERKAEVMHLLAAVGLPDPPRIARSFPHQLSGGQRQRVAIAIAIANNPSLLICDEPTTALDVSVQARVLDLISSRATAMKSALLFISHDLAVVASVCDYLLVMYAGKIVERGPVTTVLTDPHHHHTQQLLADADLSDGGAADGADGAAADGADGGAAHGAANNETAPTAPGGAL